MLSPQFQGVELFSIRFNSVLDIHEALERLDDYKIAVKFATEAIAQISRSYPNADRDLTALIEWRDRIAKQHNVDLNKLSEEVPSKTGYLLVSIKETGQSRKGVKEVILFPELHLDLAPTGQESSDTQEPLEAISCDSTKIGQYLSQLLHEAEEKLNCEEVTLELFLAWPRIEERIADWDTVDIDGNFTKLKYQRYLLRSLDRVEKWEKRTAFRTKLENNWQRLLACVGDQMPCTHFHFQKDCPEPGQLTAALSKKAGLKLISRLPEDYYHRKAIFNNIIESAIPVAFWIDNPDDAQAESISKALDKLFQGVRLTHFGTVAESLMQRRANGDLTACELQSFFDCPDRWPISLPSTEPTYEDESSIVSPL
ncbi:MAG: hypothetical protein WA885_01245 [Phormidesmis sp.]